MLNPAAATEAASTPRLRDTTAATTLWRLLGGFVRQHLRAYAASALMLACIAVMIVWLPRQIGQMVDGLVAQRLQGAALWREIAWLLGAGVLIYGLRVGWRLLLYSTAYKLGVALRVQLFERLTLQGPRFYQGRRTGDLMALATNDVDAVEMAAGEALLAGFDGSLTLVTVVAMMTLGVDWQLALVVLGPFPLMALAFWWISGHVHAASSAALAAFSRLNEQVQESLSGVRTLRALGLEARSAQGFAGLAENAAATSLRAQRWEAAYEPAVGLSMATAAALSLGFGGWLVWHERISVGQLTSFGLYLGQLVWPMFAAGWVLALIERGKAAWARLAPVLAAPLVMDDHGTLTAVTPGPLVAEQLHFSYPATGVGTAPAPALQGLGFCLPAGQVLGLVGPTGAGKSTLIKLLLRQWTPQQGTLHWGGQALDAHTLAALRAAIAWVPQEPFLFSATVAQNIALARPDASRAQIEAAARAAAVHEDITRLAQGYDTPVGERGVTLSGGQRQRVAIARALLTDAPLLLLDDALSAVDTGTEAQILAHLRADQQRHQRTVVIASHRLSALTQADQILVLRQGKLVEQGTHRQLVEAGHWYATQWRVQQLQAELDAD